MLAFMLEQGSGGPLPCWMLTSLGGRARAADVGGGGQGFPELRRAAIWQPEWQECTFLFHFVLNNKHLFLTVLKVRKSKIKVPADWVSGEDPLPGS